MPSSAAVGEVFCTVWLFYLWVQNSRGRRVMSSTLRRQQQLVPEPNNLLDTTSIDDFDAS